MKIHGNYMVGTGACEKVGNQRTSLSNPLPVPDLGLKGWRLRDGGLARQGRHAVGTIGRIGSMLVVEVCGLVRLGRVIRVGALDAVALDGTRRVRVTAVALVHLHPTELVVQRG